MSEQPDDGADYEISRHPGRPQPSRHAPVIPAVADGQSAQPAVRGDDPGDEDNDDLLASLPPMPPRPTGPVPPAAGAAAEPDGDGEVPDLEEILRLSQGIVPEHDRAIEALAAIHARWRRAWRDTDEFTDAETFELVRILVASSAGAIRALD